MKRYYLPLFWGTLLLITLHFIFYACGITRGRGELSDVDCYTRLNHVLYLHETGRWYDTTVPRSNLPYGETIHWTRPLDILLISGAWLFTPFYPNFKEALFWWGWLIGPLLNVIALVFVLWAARPILSRQGFSLIGFLFALQPGMLSFYTVGSPDHHGLLLTVFILSMGFTLRLLLNPFRPGLCYAAGAISCLSVWISVESFLPLFMNMAALGLAWVAMDKDFARKNLHFSLGLLIAACVALLLTRPWYDFAREEYDCLSIVHVRIFGFIILFWLALVTLNRYPGIFHRFTHRIITASMGIVSLTIAIWYSSPKFFGGPFVDVDPRVFPIWLNKIYNFQPLISRNGFNVGTLVMLLGPVIPVVPFVLYLLWKKRREDYQQWMYILIGLLIFIPISLYQARWTPYAAAILLFPLAELLDRVLRWQEPFLKGLLRPLARTIVVIIFCTGFLLLGAFLSPYGKATDEKNHAHYVSLSRICEYLNNRWQHQTRRIVVFYFFGPEILYRTHHEVIATPDHRNWQGVLDTYTIFTSARDEDVHQLIQKRKIDLILLCPESNEEAFFLPLPNQETTFYRKLCEGRIPAWIRPLTLPPGLSQSFRLFEVVD
jgi:hypothetical protein